MEVNCAALRFLHARVSLPLMAVLICSHAAVGDPYLAIYGAPIVDSNGSQMRGSLVASNIQHWVNDSGVAVASGTRLSPAGFIFDSRAGQWNATGSANADLDPISTSSQGRSSVFVNAINNSGISVGNSEKYGPAGNSLGTRPVRWDAAGEPTELDNLGVGSDGYTQAEVLALNSSGMSVGNALTLQSTGYLDGYAAVRWSATGTAATALGDLGKSTSGVGYSNAYDVNDAGDTVGYSIKFGSAGNYLGDRAVRWNAGSTVPIELANLGTSSTGSAATLASAVNNSNLAIGYAGKFNSVGTYIGDRAVRWDAQGNVTELATLSTGLNGKADVKATAINEAGTIVGVGTNYTSAGSPSGLTAIRWDASGVASSLGNAASLSVRDINDSGIAVGHLNDRAAYWPAQSTSPVYLDTLINPASGWRLTEAVSISNTGWITGSGFFDPGGNGAVAPFSRFFLLQLPAVPEPSAILLGALALASLIGTGGRRRTGARSVTPC